MDVTLLYGRAPPGAAPTRTADGSGWNQGTGTSRYVWYHMNQNSGQVRTRDTSEYSHSGGILPLLPTRYS